MQVDIGVVRQELCIVCIVRGIEADEHERRDYGFLDGHAVIGHVRGKLGCGQGLARLGENQVQIRIGFYVEVHDHGHLTVSRGTQRIHVVHVVHAAHLLLDRGGNGLRQRLGVCAHVSRLYLHFRWDDVGKLGYRQSHNRHGTHYDCKNCNDHRHDGTIDEELGHTI